MTEPLRLDSKGAQAPFVFIPSAFPATHQRAALHLDIHQQPPSAGEQQDNDADLSHHETVDLRPTKRRP